MSSLPEDKATRRTLKPILAIASVWVTFLIVQETYGDLYHGNFAGVFGAAFVLAFMANQLGKIMRYEPSNAVEAHR